MVIPTFATVELIGPRDCAAGDFFGREESRGRLRAPGLPSSFRCDGEMVIIGFLGGGGHNGFEGEGVGLLVEPCGLRRAQHGWKPAGPGQKLLGGFGHLHLLLVRDPLRCFIAKGLAHGGKDMSLGDAPKAVFPYHIN